MKIHRIRSVEEPAYKQLLHIYRDSQPENELKGPDQVAGMIERPEYFFLAALRDDAVVGFSISICFAGSDAALIEYMAVAREFRGQGTGQGLFKETVQFGSIAERTVIIEVDSEKSPSDDHVDRVRRKNFYRRLGCREVEGLTYIMPPVSSGIPPPMDMLVYAAELPGTLAKSRIRTWLESCYRQVYELSETDPRIQSMLKNLPENVRLI